MLNFGFHTYHQDKNQLTRKISITIFGVILIATALIIGVANYLPGVIFLFAGVVSVFYAFIYHWKDTRKYLKLFGFSFVGFVISVLLHNSIDALAADFSSSSQLSFFP